MNLKWVIGTQSEWDKAGISVPPYARRFVIDGADGPQEVILQHLEPLIQTDTGYESLCNTMGPGSFISDATLKMIMPEEPTE